MPWQDDPVVASGWQADPVVGEPEAKPRSPMQQRVREQGIGLRSTIEGASSFVTIPADAIAGLLDYALEKSGVPFRFGNSSQAVSELLTRAGLPVPENETEEMANRIGRGISAAPASVASGTVLAAKGANAVAQGVGRTMASNPALQVVGAGTGAASSEVAREAGAGPAGQVAAGIAGAVTPSIVAAAGPAVVRGAFRGGERGRQQVQDNISTFRTAGTTPSVSQATEGRVARAAESGLARTPGAAGRMANTAETQAEEVGAALEARARQLAGRSVSAEQTGRKIEESVRGQGGFVERFKGQQTALYDKLDEFLPSTTRVDVSKTRAALSALNAEIPGAPNTSRFFQNARIKSIQGALEDDIKTRPELDDASADILAAIRRVSPDKADQFQAEIFRDGKLPYEALKKLRTLVGNEIADAGIASDVPRSKWRALYAALSDDLGAAVSDKPAARAAWTRANNFARAGIRRIEAIESVIDRNGGPEAIFQAATSGTREGASTLRAVMQSVGDEGQRMITATVLRRLGRAKAGVQGDLGDRFSSETFLTNWNGLSTEAKRTLFNRYGDSFRSDMDQIAKFATNLREGSQVFRNPSGTAQATAQVSAATAFVGSLALGRLDAAGVVAGGVVGANLSARLMTNPNFVKWLAQATRVPSGGYASMVNRLAQEARNSGDLDLARAAALLEEQQPNQSADNQDRRQQQ